MSKLKEITQTGGTIYENRPPITCADGTSLSVQASPTHYCIPRNNTGPYTHVEVGYPSVPPPDSWNEYMDGDPDYTDPTQTVYGYIPVDMVREFIDQHGGELA